MRKNGKWMFVVGLLVGLSAHGAGELDSQSTQTNQLAAADIWAGMLEQGMIDDEQYQYVQENGCLPGGTTITNSPVAAEAQADWNKLAQEDVITPDELAAMLFEGDIPGLTEDEEQAFVELAPVYQPKRSRRLTYDVRRKHARVELTRLGYRLRAEREALEERAKLLGIPLHHGEGALMSIDEEGVPFYARSSSMGACDSISSDELWGTNRVNAAGQINTNFNLTGEGVTLAMFEYDGLNQSHPEFFGRVVELPVHDPGWADPYDGNNDHPNAVGATMVGAGITNTAHGMAPEAKMYVYCWRKGGEALLIDLASNGTPDGMVRFSNHSYQSHNNNTNAHGKYIDDDAFRDSIVYTTYYLLPVWAVGNDRDIEEDFDSLNGGIAKNVLGVGAIKELTNGYTSASAVELLNDSSCGPTDDGRIKPDLVAGGYAGRVIPAGGSGYKSYTGRGTSFAAPAVTGSLGLLQELHDRISGTNGVPLLASTYKGLIIHTADEAGDSPGPDYRHGWGAMNALSAAGLMAENALWNHNPLIKEILLPNGEHIAFAVDADTNQPLRVTICWTDPPGEELVNDLDLRIIGPTGTNFPWVLDPAIGHRADPAKQGDNTIDNVEQVVVTNTIAGTYTVLINHKGDLVNSSGQLDGQEVSIILSGLIPEDIDLRSYISITTNGYPRIELPDTFGTLYEISRKEHLNYSPTWVAMTNSPVYVLHAEDEWISPTVSTNQAFYRIMETE